MDQHEPSSMWGIIRGIIKGYMLDAKGGTTKELDVGILHVGVCAVRASCNRGYYRGRRKIKSDS